MHSTMRGKKFRRSNDEKKVRKIRRDDTLPLIVIRTIICIIIFHMSIWGYFTINGASYAEGIKGWQSSFQNLVGLNNKPDSPKQIIITPESPHIIRKTESRTNQHQIPNQAVNRKSKHNLYKWIDEKGGIRFSNTTYPVNNPTLKVIQEENNYNPETKITYKNGTIIVPVIVRNNGRKETIRLMLDTGCSITQLHPDVIRRLKARKIRNGIATISDGRKIKTTISKIDSIQVGPHAKSNFIVSTNSIKSKNGIDGLLGMNFLENHQFTIDKNKKVIRWE